MMRTTVLIRISRNALVLSGLAAGVLALQAIADEAPGSLSASATKNQRHWAYVQPVRPKLSAIGWFANPIDAFVLDRLQKERLRPSPAADRATLIRRVSLDLIGLPPT